MAEEVKPLLDWSNFYGATAGASATLLGLLFVATQMHIGTLTTAGRNVF